MLDAIRAIPSLFEQGWVAPASSLTKVTSCRRAVICGMGGSAFPGDILTTVYENSGLSVSVNRDYAVPDSLDATVFIVSSFSGNTEETLSVFDNLVERDANVVVVTSGGELLERAQARQVGLIRLDKPSPTFQPRAATAMFVSAFARILEYCCEMQCESFFEADMRACVRLFGDTTKLEEAGEALATRLKGRIPVFYAARPYGRSLARVAKIKINENSKLPSFAGEFPEINHNEMVGYTRQSNLFHPVVFRNPSDGVRMLHRIDMTVDTLRSNGLPVEVIEIQGATRLEAIFRGLILVDYASVYLAMMDGVDPSPVAMVEEFKDRLDPL